MNAARGQYATPLGGLFDNSGTVIWFALFTLALLTADAYSGLSLVSAIFLGVVDVAAAALTVGNWSQISDKSASGRGTMLTVTVILLLLVQIGVAVALWRGAPAAHWLVTTKKVWLVRLIILSLATTTASVYLSSLVDWAYTAPRLRGVYGEQPCRTSTDPSWKSVTRYWLLHRVIAYVVVRAGLLVALAAPASLLVPRFTQSDKTIAAAVVAAIAGFFINRITPLAIFAFSPALQVGDRVVLAEEFGTGVHTRPTYYVVDIEVSGINLMQLGTGDSPVGASQNRTHDRRVGLAEVERLLRVRDRFSGCDVRCSRANKYCPYRPGVLIEDQLVKTPQEEHAERPVARTVVPDQP